MSLLSELKIALSGWQATLVLLTCTCIALGGATFLEAGLGSDAGRSVVYHSWWFFGLFGLMVANFILLARRYCLWQRAHWGVMLLHASLIVILTGAAITHFWGYEGKMHLRTGESSQVLLRDDNTLMELPFTVTLREFRLVRYPGSNTPSSYESDLIIHRNGRSKPVNIYMNNIAREAGFRLYQSSYDPDEQGTILSINHDRVGCGVTYTGYLLLCAGLIGALLQRDSRFRKLLGSLDATGQPDKNAQSDAIEYASKRNPLA